MWFDGMLDIETMGMPPDGALVGLGIAAWQYLKTMIKSSNRMGSLVENLLRVSRVTSQGHERERVSLSEVVRDVLSGIFMLIEDQYGVGDDVHVQDVEGKVERVGLRITQVRDKKGVLWYIRNGEILTVGNKSKK